MNNNTATTWTINSYFKSKKKMEFSQGFTLIELMIVVLIISILAAIAIPSYESSIRKSRRSAAKTALLDIASREEKYYSINNKYGTLANISASANVTDGNTTIYTLSITSLDMAGAPSTDFLVKATPTGAQVNDTECGTFSINSLGQQKFSGTGTKCW